MNDEKSFYRGSNLNYQIVGAIGAICMIGLSIYLTKHYFDVKFPTGLTGGGLCDINAFFNCDVATHSPLSNIAGVPISLVGMLMGLFTIFGFIFHNEKIEGTLHTLIIINGVGCALLFIYSLVVLGGLCPACTLYYVASWLTLFAFYKASSYKSFSLPVIGAYGLIFATVFAVTFQNVSGKQSKVNKLAESLIKQYEGLPNLGKTEFQSEFIMSAPAEGVEKAKVQIVKFSDFECPACKALSDVLHKMATKYGDKISIQYFFYPLDNNCNPDIQRPLHQHACSAAYLAACAPKKFATIEREIFENQASLSSDYLTGLAKKYEISKDCIDSQETKDKIAKYMAASKPFNVRSTPTFLLNGVKIEGVLPENQLSILIDHILSK